MHEMGERNAVESKSGEPVHQSGPGLRRPTPPNTAGRKPEARPTPSQPKTGPGCGAGSPVDKRERVALAASSLSESREAASLNDEEVSLLLDFFRMLDRWDRGPHATKTM